MDVKDSSEMVDDDISESELDAILGSRQVKFNFDLLQFLPHAQHVFDELKKHAEAIRLRRLHAAGLLDGTTSAVDAPINDDPASYDEIAREEELERQMKALRDQIRAAYISILQLEGIELSETELIDQIRASKARNEAMTIQASAILDILNVNGNIPTNTVDNVMDVDN